MSSSAGQPDPQPTGYERFGLVFERATALGVEISTIGQDLSTASRESLEEVNSSISGTDVGIDWPLVHDFSINQFLKSKTEQRLRNCGAVSLVGVSPEEAKTGEIKVKNPLMDSKYYDFALEQAYGKESPRRDFIRDLIAWAEGMEQRGWPTFVRIDLGGRNRVEVDLYEGNEQVKAYLQATVDRTEAEESPEDYPPVTWVSERVLVRGDEELAASLTEQQ
ncbi:MAG TPA: hypothetical protein VFW77_01535 [Candidatus Saccharimonadales bacterium]|nr:hypothetical protein [Candidatus Saccharimonadales bacterium]